MPRPRRPQIALEVTDCGAYAQFGTRRPVARTVVLSLWPLVAVDLDRCGGVIGIETIPAKPRRSASDPFMSGAR